MILIKILRAYFINFSKIQYKIFTDMALDRLRSNSNFTTKKPFGYFNALFPKKASEIISRYYKHDSIFLAMHMTHFVLLFLNMHCKVQRVVFLD